MTDSMRESDIATGAGMWFPHDDPDLIPSPLFLHPNMIDGLRLTRWGKPKPAGEHRRENEAIKARRKRERQNRRANR